ncbi:O-antigen ligase family protein, partial [Pseudomonadota bacterium]
DRLLTGSQSPTVSNPVLEDKDRAATDSISLEQSSEFYELSIGRSLLHTSGRTGLWQSSIKYAVENPALGIGPMNFVCKGPTGRLGSPHNLAFQILSEWGIPAAFTLALLGVYLLWLLFKALKCHNSDSDATKVLRVVLITSFLAALVHLMVSSLLLTPASQIVSALVGGWLLGIFPLSQTNTKSNSALVLLCITFLCSVLLLPFAYHETIRMPSYRDQLPAVEQARPRLWQLGKACSNNVF